MKISSKWRLGAAIVSIAMSTWSFGRAIASQLLILKSTSSGIVIFDDRLQRPTGTLGGLENIDGVSSDVKTAVIVTTHSGDAWGTERVSYINAAKQKVIWALPLLERFSHTAVTGNGVFAAITQPDFGRVSIVDLRAQKIARRVTLGSTPVSALFSPDSKEVYVTTSEGTGLHILSV